MTDSGAGVPSSDQPDAPPPGYPRHGQPPLEAPPPAPGWAPAPSYQPEPAGPTGGSASAGRASRSGRLLDLVAVAPPVLASIAIGVGVILLFVADLVVALGEPPGTPGNVRLLQFLAPGDVAVAAIMILAVALVVLAPEAPGSPPTPPTLSPGVVRLGAGAVAGFVALAAFVRAITVLTIGHTRGAIKVGNMFDALAALLVAAVGAVWAVRAT